MVSHWPWHRVEVCPDCEPAFDAEFRRRLLLLAPQAVAQEADVTERVCLMCGTQDPAAAYLPSGRWVDASGVPVAGRFHVCGACCGAILASGIVSAAELRSAADVRTLLAALPEVTEDLVRRTEDWLLTRGDGPAGASEVCRGLSLDEAAGHAARFWAGIPLGIPRGGTAQRGATLLPEAVGAIRTHLDLRWRAGATAALCEKYQVALSVYRSAEGYVLVRLEDWPAC